MAGCTIAESAASARALLAASPLASREATATGELVTEWLKITLVPLLVFLIGACLWRCIKKSPAWRMLTDDTGSVRNGGVDSARTSDTNNGSIDLEVGLGMSYSVAEMATAALANVESTDEAATDSTPTDETTSDVGNGHQSLERNPSFFIEEILGCVASH